MRLDVFLKKTRIIKRRTIASEMAKKGRIKKGFFELKPSSELQPEDEIEIFFGNRILRIKITDVSDNSPSFDVISEIRI